MKALILVFMELVLTITGYCQSDFRSSYPPDSLGRNIISFTPVQLLLGNRNGQPDVLAGLSYERLVGNDLGMKLSVKRSLFESYHYFQPAVMIYPYKQKNATYTVGAQFIIGLGQGIYTEQFTDPQTQVSIIRVVEIQRKQLGFFVNNNFNFTLGKFIYLGFEGSWGLFYYDNLPPDFTGFSVSTRSNRVRVASSYQVFMGYRFGR